MKLISLEDPECWLSKINVFQLLTNVMRSCFRCTIICYCLTRIEWGCDNFVIEQLQPVISESYSEQSNLPLVLMFHHHPVVMIVLFSLNNFTLWSLMFSKNKPTHHSSLYSIITLLRETKLLLKRFQKQYNKKVHFWTQLDLLSCRLVYHVSILIYKRWGDPELKVVELGACWFQPFLNSFFKIFLKCKWWKFDQLKVISRRETQVQ
jgi:hypothetical protein